MKKIRLWIHESASSDALKVVQRLNLVEFTPVSIADQVSKQSETDFTYHHKASALDFAVSFISKHVEKKGGLKTAIEGDFERVSEKEIEVIESFDYKPIVDDLVRLEGVLNDKTIEIKKLEEEIRLYEAWKDLNIPLGELETEKTTTLCFTGLESEVEIMKESALLEGVLIHTECVGSFYFTATVFKENKDALLKFATDAHMLQVIFNATSGTANSEYIRLQEKREETLKEIKDADKAIKKHAVHFRTLRILADYMNWQKEKEDMINNASRTKSVHVFDGWCSEKKVDYLKKEISSLTTHFNIEELEIGEDEVPPVEIHNNRFIRPFEMVTRLYGLPSHTDIDPTLFLSAFFFVFFGLCLTDVGYGIVLALLMTGILTFFKVPKEMKLLMSLLLFGGVASALIGLLFGGYLGVDISLLPNWARAIQKFNPIESPIPVLFLSLALGVVQILFGLILRIVREAKNGNLQDGLLDQVPWILLFITLMLYLGSSFGFVAGEAKLYVYACITSAVLIVLTQGRKEKGLVSKAFKGVMSLYDSVGYFSDILSYSRILALGLATSALAFAVNLIAVLLRDMIPYVGTVAMIIVLIVGHLFNMIVNILGAFIHSARLQFVEFFSKFITGSGREFKPFSRREKHVVVENSLGNG